MKYSKNFERDYTWYLSISNIFNFSGTNGFIDKKGNRLVVFDKTGKDAKECFYLYDSQGKIVPTKEPGKLRTLYRTKASVNLHIQMYAEDRAKGILPKIEFNKICEEYNVPLWFIKAVEKQKYKYYENK